MTYADLNIDFDKVNYSVLSSTEKKLFANKYDSSTTKIDDIKNAIVLKMRELRNTMKEFTDEDIKWFYRLNVPETYKKCVPFFEAESLEFLVYYMFNLMTLIEKKKLTSKVNFAKKKDWNYRMSASDRTLCIRYLNIKNYLESVTETNETPDNLTKNVFTQMQSFHDEYINKIRTHAISYWNALPALIEDVKNKKSEAETQYYSTSNELDKLFNENNKDEASKLFKTKYLSSKKTYENLLKSYKTLSSIYKFYKTEDIYVSKCVADAEENYVNKVNAIIDRIRNKGFNEDNITIKDVKNDAKFYEMVITDGEKKVYCRSIWAAEMSTKMIPHFRFIITSNKFID